ncbi:MAG: tetratricopeptide repeat protein [Thermoanaerobaculia bacterium]|nr:tetratricopeptide repeat protein [Thermoanaerobaculia bacterium]
MAAALRRHKQIRTQLLGLVAASDDQSIKVDAVVEVVKTLESELIHLHHFIVAPEDQDVSLARQLETLLKEMMDSDESPLDPLELNYFLGILSLFEGEPEEARVFFESACESEESDETTDIKYKSFVMLGHLSHVEKDYERAAELHDQSLHYTRTSNVMAQALALKALNSYALGKADEAFGMFEKAIGMFDPGEPSYNEYFHRNSLLFCGAILFDKEEYGKAAEYYREALDHVDSGSYDYFDALVQLGKIHFFAGDYDESVSNLQRAVEKQKTENEYLLDTLYWLARAQLKIDRKGEARRCLERVVGSPVEYRRKPQAEELLRKVS